MKLSSILHSKYSLQNDFLSQGAVQGTLMGVRGLCNGLGPAAFGLMWHLLGIDIISNNSDSSPINSTTSTPTDEIFLGSNRTSVTIDPENVTEVFDIEEVLYSGHCIFLFGLHVQIFCSYLFP